MTIQRYALLLTLAFLCLAPLIGCGGKDDGRVPKAELAERLEAVPSTDHLNLGPAWAERVAELRQAVDQSLEGERVDPVMVGAAYGDLGRHFMAHHQVEAAAVCFANARAADGQQPLWPYLEGFLHQIQDQLVPAEAAYRQAVALDPQGLAPRLRLATVLVERGRADEAEQMLTALREAFPGEAAVLYQLGRLRLTGDGVDEAVQLLDEVVRLDPAAGAARYALGQALRRLGRDDEAKAQLAAADEREPRFDDPALGDLVHLGVTPEFYLMRADAAVSEGRFDIAVELYEKLFELGDDGFQQRMGYAFALHGASRSARDAGPWLQRSAEQLSRALDLLGPEADPALRAEALHRLGNLQAESGDEAAARRLQEDAVAAAPKHGGARRALAQLTARAGEHDRAVALYSELLSEMDEDAARPRAELHAARGASRLEAGQVEDGLADLEQATALAGDDPRLALGRVEALERFADAAKTAAAIRELQLPEIQPTDQLTFEQQVTWVRLAHKMRRYGDPSQAAEIYAEILRRGASTAGDGKPDEGLRDLRLNLADTLMVLSRFDEACPLYGEVLQHEAHADAQLGEIRCLIADGNWAAAKGKLEAGLESRQSGRLLHLLARLLAVAPAPLADGETAAKMAEDVFAARRTPDHAATVAMALAAAGRFDEAAVWQRRLIADMEAMQRSQAMRSWLREQLTAYEAGRPWRPQPSASFFAPEG